MIRCELTVRKIVVALGGLAAASILASTAAAQDKVTLTVWSDTPRLSTFKAFSDAHPNTVLKVITVAQGDVVTKLQVAMQAKSEIPDVIWVPTIVSVSQLANRRSNYLMDLSTKVPQKLKDEFYPNANVPCMVDGKLMCLRNDLAHGLVWYSRSQLKELGKSVPKTWEEFEKLGAELAALKQGYILGTAVDPGALINYFTSGGCQLAFPVAGKPNTVKVDLASENCKKPARMIDNMVANGSLAKFGPFEPDFVKAAVAGKVPLLVGPTWYGEYLFKPTFKYQPGILAAAPTLKWADQKQPLTWSFGGGMFGGWKDTPHPKEVVDLLIYVSSNPAVQANAVTMPAHAPSSIVWSKRINSDAFYANDVFAVNVETAKYLTPAFSSVRFDLRTSISKVIIAGIGEGRKVVDLLPELQAELTNVAKLNGYAIE